MMLPPQEFLDRQERQESRQIGIEETVNHIKTKVDMLNDWHNQVNTDLALLKRDLQWSLRLTIVITVLSLLDRVSLSNLYGVYTLISKLFGG